MRVKVYRNLRDGVWSVLYKGKVVAHTTRLQLKDARMIVREGGRQRVIKEKRKNVHAFIEGEYNGLGLTFPLAWEQLSYNPYKWGYFYSKRTLNPVHKAALIQLNSDGTVEAYRAGE